MRKSMTFFGVQIGTYWAIVIICSLCLLLVVAAFEFGEQFGQSMASE